MPAYVTPSASGNTDDCANTRTRRKSRFSDQDVTALYELFCDWYMNEGSHRLEEAREKRGEKVAKKDVETSPEDDRERRAFEERERLLGQEREARRLEQEQLQKQESEDCRLEKKREELRANEEAYEQICWETYQDRRLKWVFEQCRVAQLEAKRRLLAEGEVGRTMNNYRSALSEDIKEDYRGLSRFGLGEEVRAEHLVRSTESVRTLQSCYVSGQPVHASEYFPPIRDFVLQSLKLPKLTGKDNYLVWSAQFKQLAWKTGLIGHLDGTLTLSDAEFPVLARFQYHAHVISATLISLVNSVDFDHAYMYTMATSPSHVWTELELSYRPDLDEIPSALFTKLLKMRYSDSEDLELWFERIRNIYWSLEGTWMELSEPAVCLLTLKHLPKSLGSVKDKMLRIPEDLWTLPMLRKHLMPFWTTKVKAGDVPTEPPSSEGSLESVDQTEPLPANTIPERRPEAPFPPDLEELLNVVGLNPPNTEPLPIPLPPALEFNLTGKADPVFAAEMANACRACYSKDHQVGSKECTHYDVWRAAGWIKESDLARSGSLGGAVKRRLSRLRLTGW